MQYLKAGAAATILIGPFLDKGDGVTPETGITLGAADAAELMKHDGTTFVDLTSDSRTFTHKQGGMYTLVLGTGDTDTEGRLTVFIADDDVCLPVWKEFMVVNANVYDSLFAAAATDYLQVDAKQLDGSAIQQAGGYLKVKDDEGNTLANESKQDTIDANVDSILTDTGTTLDGKLDTIDGNVDAILVDTGTTLDGKIATVDTVVDGIQTDLSNVTDGLGALKALIDTLDTVADAIKAITDNLPDSGALSDLAAILTDTGTTLDTKINTVDTVVDAIKAVTDNLPDSGALTTINGYVDILDHATDGLANIKSLIDTLETVADAVKAKTDNLPTDPADDSEIDAQLATIAGYLNTEIAAILAAVDTEVAAILTDTGTTLPATLTTIVGYLDTEIAAIKAKTDLLPSGVPKNVALSNFTFLMVLASDHITPATSKTVTGQISKDGEAFANLTNSVSEIAGGFYKVDITQAEMNADAVALIFTETDCLQRSISFFPSD